MEHGDLAASTAGMPTFMRQLRSFRRQPFVSSAAGLLAGWFAASSIAIAVAQPFPRHPVVLLDSGAVKGLDDGRITRFQGIPYAEPPVGALRWSPPKAAMAWRGVWDATRFGAACPQKTSSGVFARPSDAEDCLYLNVVAPMGASKPRPVLVWIHGGGLFSGEADDYEPRKLVEDGGLVVVTFNYRLGRLGYLPRQARPGEGQAPANFGLLDQQLALRWVQRNIAAFGGDPTNVTIGGESAGAESVYALMASPGSRGLFHRAIAHSGGYTPRTPTLAAAAPSVQAFAAAAGCADQSLACLRQLSIRSILDAQNDLDTSLVVDGITLPAPLHTAFESGAFIRVPVLSGINRDEARWFMAMDGGAGLPRGEAEYADAMNKTYGDAGSRVLAQYPLDHFADAASALGAADTDLHFACPQAEFDRPISRWVTVYTYEFGDRTAPSYMADPGFNLGATHTFELQYLFEGFHGAAGVQKRLSRRQAQLSSIMVAYWSQFARTGDPNSAALKAWPPFTRESPHWLSLAPPRPRIRDDMDAIHKCPFWRKLGLDPLG